MESKAKRKLRCAVLLTAVFLGFSGIRAQGVSSAQTLSSSPDPSAGVQYVAPICSGGVRCTSLNDGLSRGSAKWDSDVGKAIDDAYAALPSAGGVIYVLSLGGCSDFSTPLDLTTRGKYVAIIGTGVATTCLNYTPSTGTAVTLATGNGVGHDDLESLRLQTITEGSLATGLVVGQNGVPAPGATLDGISISGFQDDVIDNSYGVVVTNTILSCSSASNSIGFQTGMTGSEYGDDTRIHASVFQLCATLLAIRNENPVWADGLILSNASTTWVDVPSGGLFCYGCHWFNQSGTAHWFTNAGGNLIVTNSQFEDGSTSGTSTSYGTVTAGYTIITNSVLFSAGHSVTEFVNITDGNIFLTHFANTTPWLIPKLTSGGYSGAYAQGAIQGAGGISAGGCTITNGQCSHTFVEPYYSPPVCTAAVISASQMASASAATAGDSSAPIRVVDFLTAVTVADSSTAITITDKSASDGTSVNWMCYPAAN